MTKFNVWWPGFNSQLVLLSRATVSISSGNLSTFDVIKTARCMKLQAMILLPMEILKESCPLGNIVILSQKLCHQSSVAPYSTGNRGNTCSCHVHEQSFTCAQYIFTTVKMTFNNCCIRYMVTMHWMQQ